MVLYWENVGHAVNWSCEEKAMSSFQEHQSFKHKIKRNLFVLLLCTTLKLQVKDMKVSRCQDPQAHQSQAMSHLSKIKIASQLLQNPSPIDQTHLQSSPTRAPCDQAIDWHDSRWCGLESVQLAEEAPALCLGMWDWSQVHPKTAKVPEDPDRLSCIDVNVEHLICFPAEPGETSDAAQLHDAPQPEVACQMPWLT